jgi:hypothetical protein
VVTSLGYEHLRKPRVEIAMWAYQTNRARNGFEPRWRARHHDGPISRKYGLVVGP